MGRLHQEAGGRFGVSAEARAASLSSTYYQLPSAGISQSGLSALTTANVNDGNTSANAFHTDSAGVGSHLTFDLGAGVAKNFGKLSIWTGGSLTAIWNILASNDATNWTTIHTGLNVGGGAGRYDATFTQSQSYRYWRLSKANAAASGGWHTEVQFFEYTPAIVAPKGGVWQLSGQRLVIPTIMSASGGTVTDIVLNGVAYRVHTFATVGSSTFTANTSGNVDCLVVAGGGGGGWDVGGGGGAGGLIYRTDLALTAGSYSVTVGAAGAGGSSGGGTAPSGSNSVFGSLTAIGGGGGGNYNGGSGANGGSGGGASGYSTPGGAGSGTAGQGFNGGSVSGASQAHTGGGGGGAGGAGGTGTSTTFTAGGPGLTYNINGTAYEYSRGGGAYQDGANNPSASPGKYGWGGDGAGANAPAPGFQGIVIVRYAI